MPRILNDLEVEGSIEVAATGGDITLSGATSGTLTLEAAAVTTTYTLTMPAVDAVGALSSDGAGNLSFGGITFISDLDGDTVIHTEESADDDIIRMDIGPQTGFAAATDVLRLRSTGFDLLLPQPTANSTAGGDINITAGRGKDGDPAGRGGDINITGGANGTGNSSLVRGGNVNITGGESFNDQLPGKVDIKGGAATNADFNRDGGEVEITGGAGGPNGVSSGGDVTITGGVNGPGGFGGTITLRQGANSGSGANGILMEATNGTSGGAIRMTAGSTNTVGSSGDIFMTAGNSGGANPGGDINLTRGSAGGTGREGQVIIGGPVSTADEPAIAAAGDDDTGISWPAADTLVLSANGHQMIRLDTTEVLIQGEDRFPPTITTGGDVRIRGGAGTNAFKGGDVYIDGGTGGGQNSMGADGGGVFISAADAVAATSGDGGSITLDAGNGDDTGAAGDIDITAGNAGGIGPGIGGQVNITGGNSGGSSKGGRVRLLAGNADVGGGGSGGDVALDGGTGDGVGSGGNVTIDGGTGGTSGPGGIITIIGGPAGSGSVDPGGAVSLMGGTGDGGATGGMATVQGGTGGASDGTGGLALVQGGTGGATDGDGGDATIKAGMGTGTGADGSVNLTAGDASVKLEINTTGVGFFAVTPVAQQTTSSQTPATFAANSSGIVDDSATWNGYTIGDLVAILQAYGLLA